MFRKLIAIATLALAVSAPGYAAVDEDAAQALAKKSKCFRCHAVDKKKDGPPYKEVAAKYRGKAEGPDKLFKHVTSNPMVKIDDVEEEHVAVQTKDEAQIRNLIDWILSR